MVTAGPYKTTSAVRSCSPSSQAELAQRWLREADTDRFGWEPHALWRPGGWKRKSVYEGWSRGRTLPLARGLSCRVCGGELEPFTRLCASCHASRLHWAHNKPVLLTGEDSEAA